MSTWDISRIRALAGVQPLTESYDDDGDDGMSASERALLKKAEGDLKKKGVKVKDADPDKDLHALAQRRKAKEKAKEDAEDREEAESTAAAAAEKKAEEKEAPKAEDDKEAAPKKEPEAKKEEPKKEAPKAEEKKEEPKAEPKKKGKAINPDSFMDAARRNAKSMDRTQFRKWAEEKYGKKGAYVSTLFAKFNPKSGRAIKTDECYVLLHPSMPSFMLAENEMMNQYQWIDPSSALDPLVFETEADAKKVAQYIYEWKNQTADIVKIDFSDEE